jgi:hypothetical protein
MRLACWRARPRDRERLPNCIITGWQRNQRKACFGETPKPAREARALARNQLPILLKFVAGSR